MGGDIEGLWDQNPGSPDFSSLKAIVDNQAGGEEWCKYVRLCVRVGVSLGVYLLKGGECWWWLCGSGSLN